MIKYYLALLLALAGADLSGQGFNTVNERNHPGLNWMVAETEHFRIIYPDHLEGLEIEAASVAEASYTALSGNLDTSFDHKIRLYISDVDEINNGFAVPAGSYAVIWVNVNDYVENWSGSDKWLRKVIAHEVAHIFHFEATRTSLGLLNYLVASPAPSFWTEGLAQYQTEEWDSERGDRWLRLSIFDSRPNYDDDRSLINPRLRYASGNSQMRYFAEMYGDAKLAELLAHRDSLFGVAGYHNFESAFHSTVDISYQEFFEEWLKHINVYYNTLASQMDRIDSLQTEAEPLPGDYYFDVKYSPDQDRIAVLSLPSLERPIRQLYMVSNDAARSTEVIAEGNIRSDLNWSPDGMHIAFSRKVRGENSSLLNDIFILDTRFFSERQVTRSRRAISPAFGPDGREIAYIVNDAGTGNIAVMDLATGRERYVTDYRGDIQVINLKWNHLRKEFVFQKFHKDGNRTLVVTDDQTGVEKRVLDHGAEDNRKPLISPDGNHIAFTSLRDEVPNIFITDLEADSTWRVTNLFTGAEAYDWIPASDTHDGKLLLKATETKRNEKVFLIDSNMNREQNSVDLNHDYGTWRKQSPQNLIPGHIQPERRLINDRYRYNTWSNLAHGLSLAMPYYAGPGDYGILGGTSWFEPLGKHFIGAAGTLSFGNFERSYGLFTYINNQLYPTLTFTAYRILIPSRFYGPEFLIERSRGVELSVGWPLDYFETSFRQSSLGARLRYFDSVPWSFSEQLPFLPDPRSGRQFDLRLSWILEKQRPYFQEFIHPLDGYGLYLSVTGAERVLGAETSFLIPEASAYTIVPMPGLLRLFLSGRVQVQFGEVLPQHFIGFSKTGQHSASAGGRPC